MNVTNEAKRLLKTKEDVFLTPFKAKRYLKIRELFLSSQEVVDTKRFTQKRREKLRPLSIKVIPSVLKKGHPPGGNAVRKRTQTCIVLLHHSLSLIHGLFSKRVFKTNPKPQIADSRRDNVQKAAKLPFENEPKRTQASGERDVPNGKRTRGAQETNPRFPSCFERQTSSFGGW